MILERPLLTTIGRWVILLSLLGSPDSSFGQELPDTVDDESFASPSTSTNLSVISDQPGLSGSLKAERCSLSFDATKPRQRRVLYNFDGDSCLSTKANSRGPVSVNVDDVKRLIAEVAYDGSCVDTVLVCINAQVMYYPTKVGTMRGTLSTPEERSAWPASEKRRFENLKTFFDNGVDPYAVLLAEAKGHGLEALLTFRMNDDHGNDFLTTQFLKDHPDWRLGTVQYQGSGAMNFGRDEVREYTYQLIEEAVRRYDSDGIELDFNRFPTFFKDGSTDERVAKMNSLVERVRGMLDEVGRERNRHMVLSVRVPSNYGRTPPTPETARLLGCDVPAWVSNGWVDFVAVSEFLIERGDLPINLWKQAVTTVPVYGGIECTKGSGQKNLTADEYRHAAMQLIKAGSDGIYLFNFFTSREGGDMAYEPPFEVLSDLARVDVVSIGEKTADPTGIARPDVEFQIDWSFQIISQEDRTVAFRDRSYGKITSRQWDFGDNTSSTERHPTHHYDKPGEFIVTLRVSGPEGNARRTKVWDVTLP